MLFDIWGIEIPNETKKTPKLRVLGIPLEIACRAIMVWGRELIAPSHSSPSRNLKCKGAYHHLFVHILVHATETKLPSLFFKKHWLRKIPVKHTDGKRYQMKITWGCKVKMLSRKANIQYKTWLLGFGLFFFFFQKPQLIAKQINLQ